MSNYLALTKVFLKNIKMSKSNNKRAQIIFNILILFTILFIIIPFLLISAIFVYQTTVELKDINYESIGLKLMCYIISIFTFIFSFPVIFNELFFSNDIEKLLPLPIKPIELVSSKFTACFFVENLIQVVLIIVSIISYVYALNLDLTHILISLIQIFTLPIIPMIYTAIICLLIMNFAKHIKNKETIKKIGSILIVGLFLLFFVMIGLLKDFNFEVYIQNFANGNHKFFDVMNIIFPHIDLFAKTITNNDIVSLLIYIGLNVLYLGVFLLLAKFLYFNSVIGLSSKDTKAKNNSTKLLNKIKAKSQLKAYISKEFKILVRTPSFFINCIVINIIWPIFLFTVHKIVLSNYGISDIQNMIINNGDEIRTILFLIILGLSTLLPAMNSIAATSFSREGKHFSFMKYIPVSYRDQWLAKYSISMIISFIGINIFATIFYIVIKLDIVTILIFYIISLLAMSSTNLIGMYIDSIQPKLIWDDENNALRENFNTFISMAVSLLIFGVLFGVTYGYLYKSMHMPFWIIFIIILIVLIIFNSLFIIITKKSGYKNIIEQEEA